MKVDYEQIMSHKDVRDGVNKIVEDRKKAVEYDLIKMKLGLPKDAKYAEVQAHIDDLMEIAQMVAEMGE